MKFYLAILKVFILTISIYSCSPAHILFVKNNSDQEKEIFVELKQKNISQELLFCRELVSNENLEHKAFINYYKDGKKCYHEKINSINNKTYKIILPSNYSVNVVPNNSVFPFEKIYYLANNKKCFIDEINSANCKQKTDVLPRLLNIVEILE